MSINQSDFSPGAPLSKKEARISRIEHAKLLGPLRKHAEAKAAAVEKNEDAPLFESIRAILREGEFWISADEREALDLLKRDLAAIDAQILNYSHDAVRQRHRADSLKGPAPAIEVVTKSAMEFRSKLKASKWERIKRFAPIARAIAERALHVIEGTAGLIHESEKDRAAAYGFKFVASHTLSRLNDAGAPLREILRICTSAPDLVDAALIERLAAGFGPAE